MLCVGLGVGMTMQNFVLVVQNAVPLKDIGTASSTVAFFRSLGGTIGVSVLGAVLARHVSSRITHDLAAAGLPAPGGATPGANMPPAVQEIVRAAYGDTTGLIFLICAAVAAVGILAAVLLKPVILRTSLDKPDVVRSAVIAAEAADAAPTLDQTALTSERDD
jgi:hypothetical protein